jgi:hypothetical protein
MKNILLILLTCLFFFSSCEDVIELQLNEGKDAIVVDGWLTTGTGPHYIKLFKTVPYFEHPEFQALRNATIKLSDDRGNQETLVEMEPGMYEIKAIKGAVGQTYTLEILLAEGSYKAVTTLPRLPVPVDSVIYTYKKKSAIVLEEGYYPGMFGQELPGLGDFLMIKMKKNGTWLKAAEDINLLSDQYIDGNYIYDGKLNVQKPFKKDDLVRFEFWSLSEDAFRFWEDIQTQLNNEGLFAVPSVNARTNLEKMTPQSMDIVGYFGASEVMVLETVVK